MASLVTQTQSAKVAVRETFYSGGALCFVFHPCPACRVRRRELWDSSIEWSLIVAIWLQSVQSQKESFNCTISKSSFKTPQ